MKKYLSALFLLSFSFFFYSCATQMVSPTPEWKYETEAIHLHLQADPQLNLYHGKPYTLVMCAYQLTAPNAFYEYTADEDGLSKLLECGRFDSSVAGYKNLVIQPGQELNVTIDRAEGAKYVAIVAGYYHLQKEHVVRLFQIPVIEQTRGLIRRTKVIKPGQIEIDLYLGSQEIQERKGINK